MSDFIQARETARLWFCPQVPFVKYFPLGLSGPNEGHPLLLPGSKPIERQRQERVGDGNVTFITDKTRLGDHGLDMIKRLA